MKNLKKGLFIGLSTLDFIYLTDKFFSINEKIVAIENTIAAGGPASNVAVTFSYLGYQANLLTLIGNHNFPDSLLKASNIASKSCQYFGTRKWME